MTEIQTITKTTAVTTTLFSSTNPNPTPNQIANTPASNNDGPTLNGWILLVGIMAGTVVIVTLVWNSLKLWCRKCERDSMRRPPTITYLTQDQALTSTQGQGQNRLAEVPVESVHTFQIETQALCGQNRTGNPENEIFLTNIELNRMILTNNNQALPTELVPVQPPITLGASSAVTSRAGATVRAESIRSEPPTYEQTIERDETESQQRILPDEVPDITNGNVTVSTESENVDPDQSDSDTDSIKTVENNSNVHNV